MPLHLLCTAPDRSCDWVHAPPIGSTHSPAAVALQVKAGETVLGMGALPKQTAIFAPPCPTSQSTGSREEFVPVVLTSIVSTTAEFDIQGKEDIPEKTCLLAALSGMIPKLENQGVTLPKIKPNSPWWQASALAPYWTCKMNAEENSNWPKRKKRKERKEHINHGGKHVDPRTTSPECRFHCFDKIKEEEKLRLLSEFNDLGSKNEQDSYLSGLISARNIARRRSQKSDDQKRKDHSSELVYKVRINAFISLHGKIKGRVYNIQQSLLTSEKSPKDQRGKHDYRPMKYPSAIHDIIVQHIQSYHACSSHYSLRDNPDRKYLPESLTISKMHEMFLNTYQVNVPYKVYWNTCSICDTLAMKINNPEYSTEERKKLETERKKSASTKSRSI
ncbi:hypothetical protein PR048_001687 [Dryococelus australis]|uniref:Uncharacterized protein n=1 Tax=Dryococelus australis TaxID=614101 RepID=A0ABQ9II25_9NEOP|nr:hypothetical protein PR048_001687 [Dryococelus australis]